MSTRDLSWGTGGRCVWLTTYHPVVLKVEKIRGLKLPGTPRATSASRGIPLLYFYQKVNCKLVDRYRRFEKHFFFIFSLNRTSRVYLPSCCNW